MVSSSNWRLWVQSYKQRLYHLRFIFLLLLVQRLIIIQYVGVSLIRENSSTRV